MGKFSGILIACDFDDTLVYTKDALAKGEPVPPLSMKNKEAIEHFMDEGGIFSICTGRARPAIEPLMQTIPYNGPAVVFNGAAIFDFKKMEYLTTSFLAEDARDHIQQVLDRFPGTAVEIFHDSNIVHCVQENAITRHHRSITFTPSIPLSTALDAPLPVSKALFETEPEDQKETLDFILSQPWTNNYEVETSSPSLIEVTAKDASKGSMVQKLANLLGIDNHHVYCIGDQINDLTMVRISAIPFAPANSVPQMYAVPNIHILPDCREDAVAAMINELEVLVS